MIKLQSACGSLSRLRKTLLGKPLKLPLFLRRCEALTEVPGPNTMAAECLLMETKDQGVAAR